MWDGDMFWDVWLGFYCCWARTPPCFYARQNNKQSILFKARLRGYKLRLVSREMWTSCRISTDILERKRKKKKKNGGTDKSWCGNCGMNGEVKIKEKVKDGIFRNFRSLLFANLSYFRKCMFLLFMSFKLLKMCSMVILIALSGRFRILLISMQITITYLSYNFTSTNAKVNKHSIKNQIADLCPIDEALSTPNCHITPDLPMLSIYTAFSKIVSCLILWNDDQKFPLKEKDRMEGMEWVCQKF